MSPILRCCAEYCPQGTSRKTAYRALRLCLLLHSGGLFAVISTYKPDGGNALEQRTRRLRLCRYLGPLPLPSNQHLRPGLERLSRYCTLFAQASQISSSSRTLRIIDEKAHKGFELRVRICWCVACNTSCSNETHLKMLR